MSYLAPREILKTCIDNKKTTISQCDDIASCAAVEEPSNAGENTPDTATTDIPIQSAAISSHAD